MTFKDDRSVAVIGAGVVGICCVLSLIEKGAEVRLIDRDAPGEGASYGISPWCCAPRSLPGMWKNVPRWLLDPEGPATIRPRYLLKAAPWALKFLRAGHIDGIRAVADAMDALNRPSIDRYRHQISGTGHEDSLRETWYVHAYRTAAAGSRRCGGTGRGPGGGVTTRAVARMQTEERLL